MEQPVLEHGQSRGHRAQHGQGARSLLVTLRMGSDTPHFYSHSFSRAVPEATALGKWDLPPPREPQV